jgi:hypothetical protein
MKISEKLKIPLIVFSLQIAMLSGLALIFFVLRPD